jgi:uncharacterized protein YciI
LDRLHAVIRTRGPAWDDARSLEAQAGWPAHAAFMDALFADGFLVLVGPLEGTRDVLAIVRADDAPLARARLSEDPWARADLLRIASIAPWTLRLGSLE